MANESIEAIASRDSGNSAWIPDEELVFSADALTPAQFYPGRFSDSVRGPTCRST
jgi:hypothetical protein